MFWLAQIRKDFLWDFSYKITFFGQFFGIILTVFTFFFISKTFEESSSVHMEIYENNYFLFAIIGISIVDLISLSLRSATKSIRDAQAFGYIDYLLNAKISYSYLIFCSMIYPSIIGLLKIICYFLLASQFKELELSLINSLIVIALSIITLLPFLALGLFAASFVLYFKQGDPVNFLISLIISIFSGVVFPITVLPENLRAISEAIPLTYGLDLVRKVVIFNSSENIDLSHILLMLLYGLVFMILGTILVNRVVFKIKLKGISGSY
tara:strand:+ start:1308 stop:2108 length:801 start_codon:yes stop_codon:yes gene_type:complete